MSVFENYDSRTQDTSAMPESSISSSSQDIHAEFRTRSDCHGSTVERYGLPTDKSENISFVEGFSCEEVSTSFEEVKESESREEWLAAMTKEFSFLVENKTWQFVSFQPIRSL